MPDDSKIRHRPEVLDLSHEQTAARLDRIVGSGRAWTAADLRPKDCMLTLDGAALSEIHGVTEALQADPLPLLLRTPEELEMPAVRRVMGRVREQLSGSPGIAVVDTLPLDALQREDATALFWILGQLVGRPVAQKWDGTMLYDVRDTGRAYGYGVRGSYTNVELVFHTDNAFGVAPPAAVGLLCLQPALEGGVSRFCSLYSVHDRLNAEHPAALERLYRPLLWDRQAEHGPGQPKVALAPMFRFDGQRLTARLNASLVRKGHDLAGEAMDAETADALAALESVLDDPGLMIELPLERGQLQYLNNVEVGHYRSEFTDHPEPQRRRHLVRTWHRETGRRSYDG